MPSPFPISAILSVSLSIIVLITAIILSTEVFSPFDNLASQSLSDSLVHQSKILLKNRQIDTRYQTNLNERERFHALFFDPNKDDADLFIIQLRPPLSDTERNELERDLGAPLKHYLPHHSFIVLTTYSRLSRVHHRPYVMWIGTFHPSFKLSERIEALNFLTSKAPAGLRVSLVVVEKERSFSSIELLAMQWSRALFKELGIIVQTRVADENLIDIKLDQDPQVCNNQNASSTALYSVAVWLSGLVEVLHIDVIDEFELLNFWAKAIIEEGRDSVKSEADLLLNKHGLRGFGEVIGVADSGINLDSCFFQDKESSLVFEHTESSSPQNVPVNTHRKIQRYVIGNSGDSLDSVGHGTHVASSIAGKTLNSNELSNFNGVAKDAKLAFYDIVMGDSSAAIPASSLSDFFDYAYACGARIHSNSWGQEAKSATQSYSSTTKSVDSYLHNHRDFAIVFAAGNYGGDDRPSSLATPGTAKNAISVGVSFSSSDSFKDTFCKNGILPDSSLCGLKSASDLSNSVVHLSSLGPTYDNRIKPDVVVPGSYIVSAASSSCSNSLQKDLKSSLGTSMAAALVSGSLALLRQYFREGFFPLGSRATSIGFYPSGQLLKAVLINGAFSVKKRHLKNGGTKTLPAAPSPAQGFGRFQFDRAVVLQGSQQHQKLFLPGNNGENDPSFGQTGEEHVYTFCVAYVYRYHPPRFTLVWYDVEAELSASHNLVNDLDIRVEASGDSANKVYYPNGKNARDSLNTVERVELDSVPPNVEMRVIVTAANLPFAPQSYALAASGRIVQTSCEQEFPGGIVPKDRYVDISPEENSVFEYWLKFAALLSLSIAVISVAYLVFVKSKSTPSKH